ncbi:uncharacterized protein [Nicotiana tomentosiformis]|uniref:uncharacterized protein n=1 Tax=Nicotiana tomentosiformis TaxID=4098 RepID=UPI00388CE661
MAALQHFNPGAVVKWKLERSPGKSEYIFNYVFWAFKPAIDGFLHCRPVISIDGTHVYRKYDIKLLIVVAVDASGQIFPLAFAICANESQETWTLFLNHLKEHVVKQCSGICLISGWHGGILNSVENLPAWQEPYAYHRYCVRHFKANFQKSARGFLVTAMVRMSFKQMAKRFIERTAAATSLMEMGVEFMPLPMKRFEKCRRRAHWHSFLQYDHNRNIFEVLTAIHHNRGNNVHTINESRRLCSCGKWSIYHMPSSHAIRCFQHTGLEPTNYVDKQHSVASYLNTYSGQLQPVCDEHYWPPEPFKMVCNKHYLRRIQVQKRMHIRNQMDVSDTVYARKCGICLQTGHDRRKCPSAGLGGGGNQARGGCSSNVPNYQ